MSGFNFGQIGNIMSELFDSDYVDIKRDVEGSLKEIYSNIPAHVAYSSVDNPDPTSVDVKPIIQSVTVHLQNWVDVQNDDFIVAKKMDGNGNLLAVYSGRCGNPVVSQGRKKVLMNMNATESESATPVPPINPIIITIEYVSGDVQIRDSESVEVEKNTAFNRSAPAVDGFTAVDCEIDGELQGTATAVISDVEDSHEVRFIYESSDVANGFRFLVNGLYTKNDGGLTRGYHFYKKIEVDSISENDDVYTIVCSLVNLEHEDSGKTLTVKGGAKMILVPNETFVVAKNVSDLGNGKIKFTAEKFVPTEEEQGAYLTRWYD
jgi:hypothetical protein